MQKIKCLMMIMSFVLILTFTIGCMDDGGIFHTSINGKSEAVPIKESEYTNTPELVWSFKPFGKNDCAIKVYKISGYPTYMAVSNHYYCPVSIGR